MKTQAPVPPFLTSIQLLPRVIRLKHAPHYLGMCRDEFNKTVRPFVVEVRIGKQGIGFDRLELDHWWAHYRQRNGCPAKEDLGETLWQNEDIDDQVSIGVIGDKSGSSTKSGKHTGFTASLTRITRMKPKQR